MPNQKRFADKPFWIFSRKKEENFSPSSKILSLVAIHTLSATAGGFKFGCIDNNRKKYYIKACSSNEYWQI
jgi:hypothetical protein